MCCLSCFSDDPSRRWSNFEERTSVRSGGGRCAADRVCKIEQEESQPSASVATATTQLATEAETVPAQQYPSVALQVPEITRQDVSMKLEAEDAAVPNGCSVAMMPRLGYSGNGYLSGLDAKNDSSLVLNAEIPATQHYDITVVVGASAASTCKIQVDGETVYTMKTDATNNFMRVKIQDLPQCRSV